MPEFRYTVIVTAETQEQADRVMVERINYEEEYGFDYNVWVEGWT